MKGILAFILIFSVLRTLAQEGMNSFSQEKPANMDSLQKLNIWATWYNIHQFESGGKIPLLDQQENSLSLFADTCDFCKAALEGTAFVQDSLGQVWVLNYASVSDSSLVDCRKCSLFRDSKLAVENWGKIRWSISSGFGDGVKNYRLIPYRTVAVDPKLIPYGSVLYIPLAKGTKITLADGNTIEHDGYFFAGDTGGAIRNRHIDVFCGTATTNVFPAFVLSNDRALIDAFLVRDPKIIRHFLNLHQK